jgi:hypothetical protein
MVVPSWMNACSAGLAALVDCFRKAGLARCEGAKVRKPVTRQNLESRGQGEIATALAIEKLNGTAAGTALVAAPAATIVVPS